MTSQQTYGGEWTQDKLERLQGYLRQYMVIMKDYPYFSPVYVDAFAGTGKRKPSHKTQEHLRPSAVLELFDEPEVKGFLKGSARIALEVEPVFSRYIFIERNLAKCKELEKLKDEFPRQSSHIQVEHADATEYLMHWCKETNWHKTRAVVFLDPFGMQVEWSLLEAIAATKAIDLWLLVPLWMGANRLMTKNDLPPEEWSEKLTRFFGNEEWKAKFYRLKQQPGLFDPEDAKEKSSDHEGLKAYFVSRLEEIFPGVARNPLTQYNSTNSPMYLLCFATANPKPSVKSAALGIAQHLLKE